MIVKKEPALEKSLFVSLDVNDMLTPVIRKKRQFSRRSVNLLFMFMIVDVVLASIFLLTAMR